MNVSADLLMALARAAGAPIDSKADGVVRWATEKLRELTAPAEKEWWVEVADPQTGLYDPNTCFHSIHPILDGARMVADNIAALPKTRGVRVVEISRRVLKR